MSIKLDSTRNALGERSSICCMVISSCLLFKYRKYSVVGVTGLKGSICLHISKPNETQKFAAKKVRDY